MLDKVIWGSRSHDNDAQRALEILSLFEWIGVAGRVKDQAAYIARELAIMPEDTFIEHIQSFRSRGIILQRGDFVQVQPIPLAARLGIRRLNLLPDGKLGEFFVNAAKHLQMSLLGRLRWLDTSPVAKSFASQLLSPSSLGNVSALSTEFGSECIDRLVHVDPDAVMHTIDRVFGKLSAAELEATSGGRRHLVWALQKLAFRRETFVRAATLLRRLGAAETEDRISNNASGQFKGLYQLYLSGTEARPEDRLRVLDEGLQSNIAEERTLCVDALGHMLDSGHFSRTGGAEEIGTGERLQDWSPKTYGEIWAFYRAAMDRLVDIATNNDPQASRAQNYLSSHVRGLISQVPFEHVKAMIERVGAHYGFWLEAIQGLNGWLFFDRRKAPKDVANAVRTLFDQLMPTDPVTLVELYTHGWQMDFHNPDVDYDREEKGGHDWEYSIKKSIELADVIANDPALIDKILDVLVSSDAKSVFGFARRLAELSTEPVKLFVTALAKAETSSSSPNRQFFVGLIAGTDQRDPEQARKCIQTALRSPKLKADAISMIGSGKLQPGDLRLVVSLLKSGDVQPSQCSVLSYGRGLDHLQDIEIMPLLDELERHGAEGLWTILDIISMYVHGGKTPSKLIVKN
jgi:hypothetical protein